MVNGGIVKDFILPTKSFDSKSGCGRVQRPPVLQTWREMCEQVGITLIFLRWRCVNRWELSPITLIFLRRGSIQWMLVKLCIISICQDGKLWVSIYLWDWVEAWFKVDKRAIIMIFLTSITIIIVISITISLFQNINLCFPRNGRCIDVDECSTGMAACFMGEKFESTFHWFALFHRVFMCQHHWLLQVSNTHEGLIKKREKKGVSASPVTRRSEVGAKTSTSAWIGWFAEPTRNARSEISSKLWWYCHDG